MILQRRPFGDRTEPRFFGRRKGRPLTPFRQKLLEELLPQISITLPAQGFLNLETAFSSATREPSRFGQKHSETAATADAPAYAGEAARRLSAQKNAEQFRPLYIEIGFGGGEHLLHLARAHPHIHFIGCEPFVNGYARLLAELSKNPCPNVRLFPDDARALLAALPDACVQRLYLLFADPWPKSRHAERRFLGPQNRPAIARILKPGADFITATDDPTLQAWTETQLNGWTEFTPANGQTARIERPDGPRTRYETKALKAGREPRWYHVRAR